MPKKRRAADRYYEVEEVLDEREENGVMFYLLRWKGYTADHDSWEPFDNLGAAMQESVMLSLNETVGLKK